MRCQIELAANGSLRLITPTGRELFLEATPAAITLLQRILYHADQHAHVPTAYPTQHVIEAWSKGCRIDWTQREPVVARRVVEVLPKRKPKPKSTLRAFGHEKKSGVDLSKVTFQL